MISVLIFVFLGKELLRVFSRCCVLSVCVWFADLVVAFRSDYYLTEAEMYERSGGRRSSLYDGETNDPDFNRSYGFNTSRSVFSQGNIQLFFFSSYNKSNKGQSQFAGFFFFTFKKCLL